jgi:hypothetical protein
LHFDRLLLHNTSTVQSCTSAEEQGTSTHKAFAGKQRSKRRFVREWQIRVLILQRNVRVRYLQEAAVRAESQWVAWREVAYVTRKLKDALASTGRHPAFVNEATAALETFETSLSTFRMVHVRRFLRNAANMKELKDELSVASAGAPPYHHKPLWMEYLEAFHEFYVAYLGR